MLTANEIRQQFLDFFKTKGHHIVPSAPIVVKNDPTLLFTNAGMNQFKEYFLGNKKAVYNRVADTQKCLRVSGKHNDLEEVGVDTYHHTMFEMLGNWSFGDYFKKEAIAWSWELLTKVYGINKDDLYVTVFAGDEAEGLPKDQEAYDFWKTHVAEDRILLGNKKDNFWEMGDTGPCGPCSEIHVDCRSEEERKKVDARSLINADHPQVIEIWNNVFMQFNRLKDGRLQQLPSKHVDTGMGLERLVRVLQGKQSNYDTDLFSGTIAEIERITQQQYTGGDGQKDIAFRVLADHIRAIGFTIADGQLPSSTGAGYVIRRILRRAVRYYYSYLDYRQPLLYQLMPVLAKQFAHVFPELDQQIDLVSRVVKEEEEAFMRTLEKGLRKVDELMTSDANTNTLRGDLAFELNDTYGFPIDLTELIAKERGWKVDLEGFEKEMQRQKSRSRAATALDTGDWIVLQEGTNRFVGYDYLETQASVLKYRRVKAKGKELFQLVLDVTPFYAESGGQVGDTGELIFPDETVQVTDTKKENDLIIQFTEVLPEEPAAPLLAKVDAPRRAATAVHHSATHLLHAALQNVLGPHVVQKGSLVNEERLRFDFSHFTKVSAEEIEQIEAVVNEKIRENLEVVIREMSKEEAMEMGAMALFGEKYGDRVRVVIIDPAYSIELCGGTHAGATGQLGFFKIVHESAVAAGVRRIEAVSGRAAEAYVNNQLEVLEAVKAALKQTKDPVKAVEKLLEEKSLAEKQAAQIEARLLTSLTNELRDKVEVINGIQFIGQVVNVSSAEALKKLCAGLRQHLKNHLIILVTAIGEKAFVAVDVDELLVTTRDLNAIRLIKEKVAPLIKGGGGGQSTFATAGGQDKHNLGKVIDAVRDGL